LVFAQKSGQVENIICKRVGHKGIEWFATARELRIYLAC
jgi:hypothetical protein